MAPGPGMDTGPGPGAEVAPGSGKEAYSGPEALGPGAGPAQGP